jgi:hypothetical protein
MPSPFPIKSDFNTIHQQQAVQQLEELKKTSHLHATINLAREIQVKILNNSYSGRDDLRAMDIQLLCVALEELVRYRLWDQDIYVMMATAVTTYLTVAFGVLSVTKPNNKFKIMQWNTWDSDQKTMSQITLTSFALSLIPLNSMRKLKTMYRSINNKFRNRPSSNEKLKKIINFYYDTAIEAVKQQKSFMTMGFNSLVNILAYDKERILRSINEF